MSPGSTMTEDLRGAGIVAASWGTTVLFSITAIGDRVGIDALEGPATVTAVALFGVGVVVWMWAFVRAVIRSARELITLSGLFLLHASAPRPVRVQLLGSLVAAIAVAAATASEAPFGVLEPILPLAFVGLWAARYGVFAERRT